MISRATAIGFDGAGQRLISVTRPPVPGSRQGGAVRTSERFDTLVSRLGLPPVTLHRLRHGSATMALAAGVPLKAVSEMLGHASAAFTADVYAVVAEELAEAAAVAIAAFIPRRAKNVPNGGLNEH